MKRILISTLCLFMFACGGESTGGMGPGPGSGGTGGNPGGSGGTGGTGGNPGTGNPVDLAGTWISRVQTTGTIMAPFIGTVSNANIDFVLRLFVEHSGGMLKGTAEICRLNTSGMMGQNPITISIPANILALTKQTQMEPDFNATIGGDVPLPNYNIALGANMVDQDNDGHPGVTIPAMAGTTTVNTYVNLNINLMLKGVKVTDAMTISGTASAASMGMSYGGALGAIDLGAAAQGPISVTQANPNLPFTSKHLANEVQCAQVVTMFP